MGSAHSSRFNNADDNFSHLENKLRTLLICCPSCKMFKLPEDARNVLQCQYQKGFPAIPMSVCENCCVVSEQKEAIDFLNDQIYELSDTIEKWRGIRSIEKEIDISYSLLNPPTGDAGLSGATQDEGTESISTETESPLLALEVVGTQCDVPRVPDPFPDVNDEIENISRKFSRMSVKEKTNTTTPNQPNTPHYLADISSIPLNTSKSVIADTHLDNNEYITIDDTSFGNIIDMYLTDMTEDIFSDTDATTTEDKEVAKFQANDFVETIFAGDATIQNVHISQEDVHPEKVFKIAKPQSDIKELSETVEFFIEKLHKGAKCLILQLGAADFRTGYSEDIKKNIQNLSKQMEQRNMQVVLSGPIPHPKMDNTTFSRMLGVHEWLINQKLSNNTVYINNFDSFWEKPKLFIKNRVGLSDSGNIVLKKNISTCLLN